MPSRKRRDRAGPFVLSCNNEKPNHRRMPGSSWRAPRIWNCITSINNIMFFSRGGESLKFMFFKYTSLWNEGHDPSVTNTGALGTNGNEIICSGEIDASPASLHGVMKYTVLPMDNGKFRISSPQVTGSADRPTYLTLNQVGPVDYFNEKTKLQRSK